MAKGAGSHNFVQVKEIRDGVVILRDGGLRGVLMVNALNLSLKSADEQQATIYQFQNFLNTIDFSVQISVQSRRMDIRPYIKSLEDRILEQKEELLRVQTSMYIEYIKWFSTEYDIMKKYFFVVVPYSGEMQSSGKRNIVDKFFGRGRRKKKKASKGSEENELRFEEKRSQLEQRMSVVRSGLGSLGLRAEYLDTQALLDLYYGLYNPGDTQKALTASLDGALT